MPWTIVVILTRQDSAEAVLKAAGLIAQRTGDSQTEILHIRHDPMEGFLPSEEVMTRERKQAFEAAQEQNSSLIKAVFGRWAPSQPGPKPLWREVIGSTEKMVAEETKHANLVVVQHPGIGTDPDLSGAIHALLFQSRLLTLLAPAEVPISIGRHPALAWKESEAATRAIETSLPILLKAGQVTVLSGGDASDLSALPDHVVGTLHGAGITIETKRFSTAGREIGPALLAEARACGADLLIMGAYTHTRIRELVLGGATREILHHADLPVLMRH
jgi:nucleotide-binding universal stress UspA family protein